MTDAKRLLTVKESAAYVGMPERTFRKRYQAGEISYYKPGQRLYFSEQDLDDYLNKHRVRAVR